MYRGDTFVRWWFSFWRWYHLVGVSQIIIVSPSLPLTPLSPCHITVVVVPKSWSSLRASYCSSPSHRFVWGWPLLWEEDFASKRIPSFPPLPPHSLSFPSSPSRLFLILFLLLRLFSLPFSIESHFMKLAWIAKNSLQSRKNPPRFLNRIRDIWAFTWYFDSVYARLLLYLIEANNLALYYLLVINSRFKSLRNFTRFW